MFAFALWDGRRNLLFCARDRLGIKPFYYTLTGEALIIASEIKGILPLLNRQPEINEGIIYDYLSAGWLDHTNETFFKGIRKLPAASYMIANREDVHISPYWKLPRKVDESTSFDENSEQFRMLFEDSVRIQMRSDVTVGCCLSGGMDSSALVSVAAPLTPYRMKTFTARYNDPSMDEWMYVQHVARRVPIDTESIFADPEDFWHFLPEMVWIQEEPFAGPSVYAQWRLMSMIRTSGVSVVLDGQGGDEILCGYAKFFYYFLMEMWRSHRWSMFASTLFRALNNGGMHLLDFRAARRYLPGRFGKHGDWLLRPDFQARHKDRDISRPAGDIISQQVWDIEKYSLPVLLRYEDKNSMAHSVESRVPFLDHRIVEFALSLPSGHKLWGGRAKRVMRHALADIMPPEVLERRTKLGFGGTFSSWIVALQPYFESWIHSSKEAIDPYVNRKALAGLLSRHDPTLFLYIILDRWLARFGYS